MPRKRMVLFRVCARKAAIKPTGWTLAPEGTIHSLQKQILIEGKDLDEDRIEIARALHWILENIDMEHGWCIHLGEHECEKLDDPPGGEIPEGWGKDGAYG